MEERIAALEWVMALYDQGQLTIEGDNGNDPIIKSIRAAIAKAKGETE